MTGNNELKIRWNLLTQPNQIEELNTLSNEIPVVIFKHSTRCSVSRMALKLFENHYTFGNKMELFFIDVLESRPVSNEIASRFNVVHQSPQILVIKNGATVFTASHSDIDATEL